jgi:uncharacterized spore protein YtfJ
MNGPVGILQAMADKFSITADVKHVFGEPIQANGRTVVPLARVRYGMGAGSGGASKGEGSQQVDGGGGGGGGVNASPAGVLEISDNGVQFIYFCDIRRFAAAVAAGFLLGFVFRGGRRKR